MNKTNEQTVSDSDIWHEWRMTGAYGIPEDTVIRFARAVLARLPAASEAPKDFRAAFPDTTWLSSQDFHALWQAPTAYRADLPAAPNFSWHIGMFAERVAEAVAAKCAASEAKPMTYEQRHAIKEGERIARAEEYFKARHPMLDTIEARRTFEAGFDRGYDAAPAIRNTLMVASEAGAVPFDMVAHLARQREWSERTFGPGARAKGVVDHIRKELCEIEADPGDLKEWVDVVILALDGAWRSGATPVQIVDAIAAKQTKNESRHWPDWRTADPDKAIEHDRSADAAPPAPPYHLQPLTAKQRVASYNPTVERQKPASAAQGLLAADHQGMKVDYSGLLMQASNGLVLGHKETGLAEMLRQLQGHLTELGLRWYEGDTAVVDELLQLYCIGEYSRKAVRAAAAAPAAQGDERASLRGAANLAFNALHECKPNKGAEKQHSDAIQALTEALHDIAYTVNRTATPQQFADHLQREARAALSRQPSTGDAELSADDMELFAATYEHFDDGVDTTTSAPDLMRFVSMGLLECTRFEVTEKGNAIYAASAKRAADQGDA